MYTCTRNSRITRQFIMKYALFLLTQPYTPFPPPASPYYFTHFFKKMQSNPIIPDEAWGYLLAGYAVYVAVSQYVSALSSFALAKPKLTLLFQAIGAIVFAFVTIILALVLKLEDNGLGAFDSSTIAGIQFLRSTLLLGSIFMLFGFLVVFIPAVPFTVKKGTWKAKVVEAMQSDCMRMVALTAYTFMGAAQVAVASSIYIVATNVLELATTDALGMAVL